MTTRPRRADDVRIALLILHIIFDTEQLIRGKLTVFPEPAPKGKGWMSHAQSIALANGLVHLLREQGKLSRLAANNIQVFLTAQRPV